MSRTAKITAEFAGEEREFALLLDQIIELQEKRDAGPDWILARIMSLQYRVEDVIETIRLGLIGGGLDAATARKLTKTHVEERLFDFGGDNGLVILAQLRGHLA